MSFSLPAAVLVQGDELTEECGICPYYLLFAQPFGVEGFPSSAGMSWKREQELERIGIDEPEVNG